MLYETARLPQGCSPLLTCAPPAASSVCAKQLDVVAANMEKKNIRSCAPENISKKERAKQEQMLL